MKAIDTFIESLATTSIIEINYFDIYFMGFQKYLQDNLEEIKREGEILNEKGLAENYIASLLERFDNY